MQDNKRLDFGKNRSVGRQPRLAGRRVGPTMSATKATLPFLYGVGKNMGPKRDVLSCEFSFSRTYCDAQRVGFKTFGICSPEMVIHSKKGSWASAELDAQVDNYFLKEINLTIAETSGITNMVQTIKNAFPAGNSGEIILSAYDVARIALIPHHDGQSAGPQFPEAIHWIIDHQNPSGSWGNDHIQDTLDLMCCTLACLIALQAWEVGASEVKKGLSFIDALMQDGMKWIENSLPADFKILFLILLDEATKGDIAVPNKLLQLKHIGLEKRKIFQGMSLNQLCEYPTYAHFLESREFRDWKRISELQLPNGSFFNSPAITACAFMHTQNEKCFKYLNSLVQQLNHADAVSQIRLMTVCKDMQIVNMICQFGISRHFTHEFEDIVSSVYRIWPGNGIKRGELHDPDTIATIFYILRLNGYEVSSELFVRFNKDESVINLQSTPTILSLYRASQLQFPEEYVLEELCQMAKKFLQGYERNIDIENRLLHRDASQALVDFHLKCPWICMLQRLEARQYIQFFCNRTLPNTELGKLVWLAKMDFNFCQYLHQQEMDKIKCWSTECQFEKLAFARQKAVECFFSAAATIYEPGMSNARRVWAQCSMLTTFLDDYYDVGAPLPDLELFLETVKRWDVSCASYLSTDMRILFLGLYNTVNAMSEEAHIYHRRNILPDLKEIWIKLLSSYLMEAKWRNRRYFPSMHEYMKIATVSIALEPIVLSSMFFLEEGLTQEMLNGEECQEMMSLVNTIGRLLNDIQGHKREESDGKICSLCIYLRENPGATEVQAINILTNTIKKSMRQLIWKALGPTRLPKPFKNLMLNMAKILHLFYQNTDGYSSRTAMKEHVKQVLFEAV